MVAHVWKGIQEQQIPHSLSMLDVAYELYAEANDVSIQFLYSIYYIHYCS